MQSQTQTQCSRSQAICKLRTPENDTDFKWPFANWEDAVNTIAGQDRARHSSAQHSRAQHNRTGHSTAQGREGQGRAGQGRAGQGRAGQGTVQHSMLLHLIAKLLRRDFGRLFGQRIAVCCMHVPSLFCFQPFLVRTPLRDQQHVKASLRVEGHPVGGSVKGYFLKRPRVVQLD